jgi:HD superfamily phosphodiesterase
LAAVSDLVMIRHCRRAYAFGIALAEKGGLRPDREALYVSCLLHDLGLEAAFEGPGDFETNGARAAASFLASQGAPDAFCAGVAEAIELHTELASAKHARAEVACLHMGAMMDVFGARLERIAPEFVQQVVAEFPRAGVKTRLADLLRRQIETKPTSRIGVAGRAIDIPARVHGAAFPD